MLSGELTTPLDLALQQSSCALTFAFPLEPRWLVYDTQESRAAAAHHFQLPFPTVSTIRDILYHHNRYAGMLRMMGELPDPERASLILRFPPLGSTDEVAAIYDINGHSDRAPRSITLLPRDVGVHQAIRSSHPMYFSLAYPLLFPSAPMLWEPKFKVDDRTITMQEYYAQRLINEPRFRLSGRLQHQFLLDLFTSMEEERLDYIEHTVNQRIAQRNEIIESIEAEGGPQPGRIYLPDSFTNSPRQMRRLIDDGLATVSTLNKPTFFITVTCNTRWPEFIGLTTPDYNPADDPVMVSRVFHAKLSKILDFIRKYPKFQRIIYEMYVIEFQKRGLPHAHIVIKTNWEPQTPEEVDEVLSAEMPREAGRLRDLVQQFMVHACSPDR